MVAFACSPSPWEAEDLCVSEAILGHIVSYRAAKTAF